MKNDTYINFCRDDVQASFASMTIGIDKQQRKLLFAIEDERVLRRKYKLYDGNVRKYIFDRIKEFNLETDNIEILDTHGITNSEIALSVFSINSSFVIIQVLLYIQYSTQQVLNVFSAIHLLCSIEMY